MTDQPAKEEPRVKRAYNRKPKIPIVEKQEELPPIDEPQPEDEDMNDSPEKDENDEKAIDQNDTTPGEVKIKKKRNYKNDDWCVYILASTVREYCNSTYVGMTNDCHRRLK